MGKHPALLERYGTPEAVQEALDRYFTQCDADERPYTHTGVANAVGLDGARALWNYTTAPDGSERGEFRSPLKKACHRVDQQYEERLASGKPVGSIFALKNRGWTDQTQVTHELAGDGWGELLAGLAGNSVGNSDDDGA